MDKYGISIKGLIYSVFKHWRSIIIAALLGVILANLLIPVLWGKKTDSPGIQSQIESLEKKLDKDELKETRNVADVYLDLQDEYDSGMSYLNNSIRMQLDMNAVPTCTSDFLITTNGTTDTAQLIADAYKQYIVSNEFAEILAEKLGTDIEIRYIKELIGCTSSEVSEITNAGSTFSNHLVITFLYSEKETCLKGSNIICDEVVSYADTLKGLFSDFELTSISSQYSETYSSATLTNQETKLENLSRIQDLLKQTTQLLDENQVDLFNLYISSESHEGEDLSKVEEPDSGKKELPFSVKNTLIGVLAGAFILAAVYTFIYALSGKIKEKEDVSSLFEIANIGSYRVNDSQKRLLAGVDRVLDKAFNGSELSKSESLEIICTNIRVAAEKSALSNIYFTGTHNSAKTEAAEAQISKMLAGSVKNISCGVSPLTDHESLEKMASADGVVLFEHLDRSSIADIKATLDYCNKYNVNVIGYVTLI